MIVPPRYQARVHTPPLWSVIDTFTQEFVLDERAGLGIARWGDRRVAEAEAARLNKAYERTLS